MKDDTHSSDMNTKKSKTSDDGMKISTTGDIAEQLPLKSLKKTKKSKKSKVSKSPAPNTIDVLESKIDDFIHEASNSIEVSKDE